MNSNISFYNKIDFNTLYSLIEYYQNKKADIPENKKLCNINIVMNINKFEDTVENFKWQFEFNPMQNVFIKLVTIQNIKIFFILIKTISYDDIQSYPVYD